MTGIYALTLRAPDGRERKMVAWFPDEGFWQRFSEKARRNGIEIINEQELH